MRNYNVFLILEKITVMQILFLFLYEIHDIKLMFQGSQSWANKIR